MAIVLCIYDCESTGMCCIFLAVCIVQIGDNMIYCVLIDHVSNAFITSRFQTGYPLILTRCGRYFKKFGTKLMICYYITIFRARCLISMT